MGYRGHVARARSLRASAYSPRSDANCKSTSQHPGSAPRPETERERDRRNKRARREYARLARGMAGHRCWFLTLVRGHCQDASLRPDVWHYLLTRMRQRWHDVQAWTCYEYGRERRGVHLHAVIKGVPDISLDWTTHILELLGDGTKADLRECSATNNDGDDLARYLTKQLGDPSYADQWPRHFRPVSVTRGWCPDCKPERASAATSRGRSGRNRSRSAT